MTCNRDRLLPSADTRLDPFHHNRSTEYRTIKNGADRSVRALPHFLQVIFTHTGAVGSDGGTLYGNAVFFGSFCRIDSNLVICFIPVFQPEIIIFCLQIHKGKQQLVFDHFPQNPGHFIPVHLY